MALDSLGVAAHSLDHKGVLRLSAAAEVTRVENLGPSRPAMVRAGAAHGAVEFFQRLGLDPDKVLERVQLSRAELADPAGELTLQQYCRMFEVAAELSRCSTLGLEFGAAFLPQHLGYLGYLAVTAPTLGHSLRCLADELPFHQQGTFIGIDPFGSTRLAVSYGIADTSVQEKQQDAELSLAVLLNLLRQALGPLWSPCEVHFSHRRSGSSLPHQRVFGAVVRFGEEANRIVFARSLLEAPMARRDDALHGLLAAEIARQKSAQRYDPDIVATVRYQIERLLPAGVCDLDAVAEACNLPCWSLKRKLHTRGLTFQDLVLAVRRELAPAYLIDRRMPATEVALCLGYSELSAFSRAFRQWTGLTPREFVKNTHAAAGSKDRSEAPS
jgi:AraC-like DNA-binding protein